MISKCANHLLAPPVSYYLHQGKLYRFERDAQADSELLMGFDPMVRKHSAGVQFLLVVRELCCVDDVDSLQGDWRDHASATPAAQGGVIRLRSAGAGAASYFPVREYQRILGISTNIRAPSRSG